MNFSKVNKLHRNFSALNRAGASPGTFFTVSGTARMVPAEAPKMLIGSKQSVPVDKTLKAALLSILNNVEDNSTKSNVFDSSKSLKASAVEYLIFKSFSDYVDSIVVFLILIWNDISVFCTLIEFWSVTNIQNEYRTCFYCLFSPSFEWRTYKRKKKSNGFTECSLYNVFPTRI